MTCTFTDRDFYSEYINTELRGEGGILDELYRPSKNGIKIVGGDIYVTIWDTDNMSTAEPSCSAFPGNTGKCNRTVQLTMANRMIDGCFQECEWLDISSDSASLMGMATAHISVLTGYVLDLIYASMIAGGTAISTPAAYTDAQIAERVNRAMLQIAARGGRNPNILVSSSGTVGSDLIRIWGAQFRQVEDINRVREPWGALLGYFNGAKVWVTSTALATAETTPVDVGAIIWDKMGYAYAADGSGLGAKYVFNPEDPRGVVSNHAKLCFGYGLLEDELVYYIDLDS